jgi:hypothetical protein
MDWLQDHVKEIIIPNLRTEVAELTGLRLDSSLGEFTFVADPLDEDPDEECEEFEITIHLGSLCLVDACFLLEEVETGMLSLCIDEVELRDAVIKLKLDALKKLVIPELRTELAHELSVSQWNPELAELLELTPEILEEGALRLSSGGYPPVHLMIRHPHFDPDTFEVATRLDPMAKEEWVDWTAVMPQLSSALKSIGEEYEEGDSPQPNASSADSDDSEPSAEDLEDQEISDLEDDSLDEAPGPKSKGGKGGKGSKNLLATLEKSLGIKLDSGKGFPDDEDDDEDSLDEDDDDVIDDD